MQDNVSYPAFKTAVKISVRSQTQGWVGQSENGTGMGREEERAGRKNRSGLAECPTRQSLFATILVVELSAPDRGEAGGDVEQVFRSIGSIGSMR